MSDAHVTRSVARVSRSDAHGAKSRAPVEKDDGASQRARVARYIRVRRMANRALVLGVLLGACWTPAAAHPPTKEPVVAPSAQADEERGGVAGHLADGGLDRMTDADDERGTLA